ncbi:MAG: 2-C-methyl-D-erythritol 2,4-cyclodiphosphate synthase, partial [Muribaculaceae bacterium]|nr:2-C-methyl-D-erythritol 2,4-cyclodiphosphate synthase [Muribaculaceae bacterium]
MMTRIGMGFDVHRLVPDRDLWMCGVKIDHELGLLGHSDADVGIHALCDALLGAANLRDIGYHFPDTDPKWKGADSRKLLARVIELLAEQGYTLGNCDITICAER